MRDLVINPSLIPAAENMHAHWHQAQIAATTVSAARCRRTEMLKRWKQHLAETEQRLEAYQTAKTAALKAIAAADADRRPESIQAAEMAVRAAAVKRRAWAQAVQWMKKNADDNYGPSQPLASPPPGGGPTAAG